MPSQRIFRRLHSTQALLVDIRRDPAARAGLLLAAPSLSAPGDRSPTDDWKVWNMLSHVSLAAALYSNTDGKEMEGSTAHDTMPRQA